MLPPRLRPKNKLPLRLQPRLLTLPLPRLLPRLTLLPLRLLPRLPTLPLLLSLTLPRLPLPKKPRSNLA